MPTTANTSGSDKTMISKVTGMVSNAPYLIEDWNTTLSVSFFVYALSFEKAGNSIVVMGTVKKVITIVKLTAT